jgi:SAM-dependent methyltransferase
MSLKSSLKSKLYQSPIAQTSLFKTAERWAARLSYASQGIRPTIPHQVGTEYYRKHSAFPFEPDKCPCDAYFNEYLKAAKIEGQNIFHFGTGVHHIVGLENQKCDRPNEIFGITASSLEQQSYVTLTLKDRQLANNYKVIFADIYTLSPRCLPSFDVISLFHLCEFYLERDREFVRQDDRSLVQLFLDKLNPGGKILFYNGSIGWNRAQEIVQELEQTGQLVPVEQYKSLLVYTKA